MPSPRMYARANESEYVTVLETRKAEETDGGGAENYGGADGSGAAGVERTGARPDEVLVRFTAQEEHPEVGGKLRCGYSSTGYSACFKV